ncbi:MAG: AsnC family transcriptional regulator [Hyphomicrobiales bacterium]
MTASPAKLDAVDRAIVAATQEGLPLVERPFEAIARSIESSPAEVMERMRSMQEAGVIRRIAAVPNHYALGMTANGMSVWDVDDLLIEQFGEAVGQLDFVTHCYHRPRRAGWSFNLYAMVHGSSRAEVLAKVAVIARLIGPAARNHDVLFSTRILKKTGFRLSV